MALKRIARELREWAPESGMLPEGFMAVTCEDPFQWHVVIPGPEGNLKVL